ncbi:MAG: glycosyltransferase family 4 protein [Parcubacteria group bacterium]|nr:glycosyltransferase family 4 protein [Parcubacteria group bacterium]
MKIYFIGQKGIPANGGGVERHVEELAVRLAERGQDVFVYARHGYTKTDITLYKGVHILYTPALYTKHLEAISHTFLSILNLIGREVDIVHIHSIGPSLLIPLIRLCKPRARIVATVHSPDYFHQKWNRFARFMLRLGEYVAATWAKEVITVSQNLQRYVWHAYHCRASYIPNGVALPPLQISSEPLKAFGLEANGYIVAISRLIRHKGLHLLIAAYKTLKTDKKLVIVGSAVYTDDYVQELHALAAGDNRIVFAGQQGGATLEALFAHAHIFVQPSESEGLSIALLEALSHNQAVLASDIPENVEAIGDLGLTFAHGNSADLATKLQFMLIHGEIVKQYKQNGREHVQRHYNWDDLVRATLDVYHRALKPPTALRRMRAVKQTA